MVLAAPVVATIAFVALYGVLDATHRGPEAMYWNRIRQRLLPRLDRLARRLGVGYAAYEMHECEYAGTIDRPVEEVDELLADYGFERMPLSAWKTLADGRSEDGSWALRDQPLSVRQLHVILFSTGDGATDLYVHDEFNAFHPLYATKHYESVDYDPPEGKRQLTELLGEELETADRTADEPIDQPVDEEVEFDTVEDVDDVDDADVDDVEVNDAEPAARSEQPCEGVTIAERRGEPSQSEASQSGTPQSGARKSGTPKSEASANPERASD